MPSENNFNLLRLAAALCVVITHSYALVGLPEKDVWLGKLFGKMYAKWCVRQMLYSVRDNFKNDGADIVSDPRG
jgi:hypothetical protein